MVFRIVYLCVSGNANLTFMRIVALILFYFFLSCNHSVKNSKQTSSSVWQNLKDSFARQNLNEFLLDDALYKKYKSYHKINNNLLDSTISNQWSSIFLYSWQQRDTSFIEFTTIIQEEDRGVRIMYYVFNRKDSMLSAIPVAWQNMEAEYRFDTWSRFTSKDTLQLKSAQTLVYEVGKRSMLIKTKGDTSIVEIAFRKDGTTKERTIFEKKELKLE